MRLASDNGTRWMKRAWLSYFQLKNNPYFTLKIAKLLRNELPSIQFDDLSYISAGKFPFWLW